MTEELCASCGHAKSLHPPWCHDPYIPGTCNFQYDLCTCPEFKPQISHIIYEIKKPQLSLINRPLEKMKIHPPLYWAERHVKKMSADNFHFDITGARLYDCLNIAFGGAPGSKATHWIIHNRENSVPRMILCWNEDEGTHPLPAPMSVEDCEPFVMAWLRMVDYGEGPDIDGSVSKGWRVYNELWGKIDGFNTYSFVAIEPAWLMHGK